MFSHTFSSKLVIDFSLKSQITSARYGFFHTDWSKISNTKFDTAVSTSNGALREKFKFYFNLKI